MDSQRNLPTKLSAKSLARGSASEDSAKLTPMSSHASRASARASPLVCGTLLLVICQGLLPGVLCVCMGYLGARSLQPTGSGTGMLEARGEVLFWRVCAAEPSGKFTDCQDGRKWSCRPTPDTSGTVTHEIIHGRPIADTSDLAQPLHAAPKWKWWLLRRGISVGNDANG
jgi:hypothetical protein